MSCATITGNGSSVAMDNGKTIPPQQKLNRLVLLLSNALDTIGLHPSTGSNIQGSEPQKDQVVTTGPVVLLIEVVAHVEGEEEDVVADKIV